MGSGGCCRARMTADPAKLHSVLSPSGSHRWTACTASVDAGIGIPPSPSNAAAEEGTDGHTVLQCLLEGRKVPKHLAKNTEMLGHAESAAAYIRRLAGDDPIQAEPLVRIPDITYTGPKLRQARKLNLQIEGQGHIDALISTPKRTVIVDYKYGRSPVEVQHNSQLMLYALGVTPLAVRDLTLVIIQPRAKHKDGPIREWQVPPKKLRAFVEDVRTAMYAINTGKTTYAAGDHCFFCPYKRSCETFAKTVMVSAKDAFAEHIGTEGTEAIKGVAAMSNAELARTYALRPLIVDFLAQLDEEALARMRKGVKLAGIELGETSKHRQWIDEDYAEEVLRKAGEEPFKETLLTPSQAMQLPLTAKVARMLEANITKPKGSLTIVRTT